MQGLVLQDLKIAAGAIELGAQRGAYRANEMKLVGEAYERILNFIRSAEPAAPAAEGEGAAAEVTETAPTAENTAA
jgi:hypothetical protein